MQLSFMGIHKRALAWLGALLSLIIYYLVHMIKKFYFMTSIILRELK